jgi:hypothetical protein
VNVRRRNQGVRWGTIVGAVLLAIQFLVIIAPRAAAIPSCPAAPPFTCTAPYATGSGVGNYAPSPTGCTSGSSEIQAPTFNPSTGVAKTSLLAMGSNSCSSFLGQMIMTTDAGMGTSPSWTYTGTTGTILSVSDKWSFAYSVAMQISCGNGLPATRQDAVAQVAINGSTLDTTLASIVGSGKTTIYTDTFTACGTGPTFTASPAPFWANYTVSLTHGDSYVFDAEADVHIEAYVLWSSSSPAYSAQSEVSIEPSTYSTTLTSFSGS